MPAAIAADAEPFGPLDRCVPADAMAVYFGRPSPEMLNAPPGGTAENLASWLVTLKGMGLIPRDGRIAADIIGTVPILWRRPHALMMLDASVQEARPNVYRLGQMQAALVIASKGIELAIERRVRDLLATYTEPAFCKIEQRDADGTKLNRLIDSRLPAWAIIEWGQVGSHFLVTFGNGASERMLGVLRGRTACLADNEWFKTAHGRVLGSDSGIEIYVDIMGIRQRLEAEAKDRPAAVLEALHVQNAEKLIWTTGNDERAVRSLLIGRAADGKDYFFTLAGRENASPEVAAAIPAEASSFLVLRLPLGQAFRDIRRGYLESQGPGLRQAVHDLWMWLQQQYGFDSETQVLDQLGDHFVVHTWPPHPLRLPMMCTIWIQISGNSQLVARAVDRMMTAWQESLAADEEFWRLRRQEAMSTTRPSSTARSSRSAGSKVASSKPDSSKAAGSKPAISRSAFRLSPQVRHEPDGLWTCQLGLINPALAVTDHWVVISWSPDAVRANLKHLHAAPSTAPAR